MASELTRLVQLIAIKRAAGRPKDLAHIHELETIKKILAGEL